MRKAMWTTVGLVALSILLCGSGELLAQSGTGTVERVPVTEQGIGGSGRATGNTAERDTGDRSTVGSGSLPTQGARDPGAAVVNAIYTGTVRSVSAGQMVLLDDEGQSFTVELGERTRVLRDGKRITARQLEKGTRVRATVDLLAGHTQAMEIVTLPSAR